jgi:hypothetical protein
MVQAAFVMVSWPEDVGIVNVKVVEILYMNC